MQRSVSSGMLSGWFGMLAWQHCITEMNAECIATIALTVQHAADAVLHMKVG